MWVTKNFGEVPTSNTFKIDLNSSITYQKWRRMACPVGVNTKTDETVFFRDRDMVYMLIEDEN